MEAEALLSEIDKHRKPLFQHVMLDHTPRFSVFMLVTPTPLLFERCLSKRPWLTMSWLGNNYPQWKGGEKTFQCFFVFACYGWIFPALTWWLTCAWHFYTICKHIFGMPVFMKRAKKHKLGPVLRIGCVHEDRLFPRHSALLTCMDGVGRDLWNLNESIRC